MVVVVVGVDGDDCLVAQEQTQQRWKQEQKHLSIVFGDYSR